MVLHKRLSYLDNFLIDHLDSAVHHTNYTAQFKIVQYKTRTNSILTPAYMALRLNVAETGSATLDHFKLKTRFFVLKMLEA